MPRAEARVGDSSISSASQASMSDSTSTSAVNSPPPVTACEGSVPLMPDLLDDGVIAAALAGLQWEREGASLQKTVKRKDFAAAMAFVNRVAELAEEADHHPDISVSWNTVVLTLSTHSAGGITQLDLDLAGRIDGLG